MSGLHYALASISRLLKIIGLFRKISSLLLGSFAKETDHFKEPTNGSHPIAGGEKEGCAAQQSIWV